jgi:hypothetical protein
MPSTMFTSMPSKHSKLVSSLLTPPGPLPGQLSDANTVDGRFAASLNSIGVGRGFPELTMLVPVTVSICVEPKRSRIVPSISTRSPTATVGAEPVKTKMPFEVSRLGSAAASGVWIV